MSCNINNLLLLNRAENLFSISGDVPNWLARFHFDQSSNVSIDIPEKHSISILASATCGVPQGSTLGPILFSMYVALLEQLAGECGALCHQYVDDTQLYMRLIPGSGTLLDLSQCADHVARWFLANGLLP